MENKPPAEQEPRQVSENLGIPVSWKEKIIKGYPGEWHRFRDLKRFKVVQVDLHNGFLGLENKRKKKKEGEPTYRNSEYFFDGRPELAASRDIKEYGEGRGNKRSAKYNLDFARPSGKRTVFNISEYGTNPNANELKVRFKGFGELPFLNDDEASVDFSLDGSLSTIWLRWFPINGSDGKEGYIDSPHLFLMEKDDEADKLGLYVASYSVETETSKHLKKQQEQDYLYVNEKEGELFNIQWETVGGETDQSMEQRSFLSVVQRHLPSGAVRSLMIPTKLDIPKIKEALHNRAPYHKDQNSNLIVPWRNIDQIVGASLSYSNPKP